jgi:hypothetical protein
MFFLGSEILFLAAAGDCPPTGLGLGLAARGYDRGSRARPLCAWGSPICEDIRVLYGVSIDAGIDTRRVVAWYC